MNDRKRILIMLPVLAIAAWLALFGDKRPAGADVVAPVARGDKTQAPQRVVAATASAAVSGEVLGAPPPAVASGPVSSRAGVALALKEPSPKNLFAAAAPPAAPVSSTPISDEDAVPPPPSFVVIGSVLKDGRFNVFLDKDGQTYVATPGAVIDGNRVDVVKSDQVQLFNLSTKTTQIIPIEGDK